MDQPLGVKPLVVLRGRREEERVANETIEHRTRNLLANCAVFMYNLSGKFEWEVYKENLSGKFTRKM